MTIRKQLERAVAMCEQDYKDCLEAWLRDETGEDAGNKRAMLSAGERLAKARQRLSQYFHSDGPQSLVR